MGRAVDCLRRADTFMVVGVENLLTGSCCRNQIPPFFPAEGPAGAVVIAGGVAGTVIGDGLAVVSRQQIIPVGVFVSVGMTVGAGDIAEAIIGVSVGIITDGRLGQLIQIINFG